MTRRNTKYTKLRGGLMPLNSRNTMSGQERTITVTGKTLLAPILGTSVGSFPLAVDSTIFGARLKAFGDLYQEYRFRRLVIKLNPAATGAALRGTYGIGYSKTVVSNTPTSFDELYQLVSSRLSVASETVPQTLIINTKTLSQGTRIWYNCSAASGASNQDRYQGVIYMLSSVAGLSPQIEVSYTVQFRGATNPTVD